MRDDQGRLPGGGGPVAGKDGMGGGGEKQGAFVAWASLEQGVGGEDRWDKGEGSMEVRWLP